MIGTPVVDSTKLFFGLANLYVGLSSTYEETITAVLSDSDYLSSLVNVSIIVNKEFQSHYKVTSVKVLEDILAISSNIDIEIEFIEMTEKTLSFSLGGDGADTNILNHLLSQPTALRAELVFTYPNKTNTMTLILPKVKVSTESVPLDFQGESPMQTPMTLSALYCTHANWSSNPMGRIIFA